MSLVRILKEIRDLEGGSAETNLTIGPAQENPDPLHYQATMIGPNGSPFEDGIYVLDILFRENHPFSPPIIKCLTRTFHPNIDEDGNIYVDVLHHNWDPSLTIEKTLLSIQSILSSPDVDTPSSGNSTAAYVFLQNRTEYETIARECTQKYAM
ncbi:unnamed protein product [Rotaria magnacalcarata]|uniref:UBC core domain-containing protein n=2 Tax=Rotaria magnacalcarata TaxID=392030 RepID=A0A816B1H1_9BILA|nr:unnamed protein product [Rotaria magnacalcarata]CAF1604982.1 unnamed protein product [Rotaria magnacalcarata]CAF2113216.1 unnamed protein product [Rotaria magnacalcarata]CAF4456420.1 unnamed protein product [Rotaria magnacalcarata]CAF5073292.1 unnamed protein product [Rotaria magnacalcarata]